MEVGLETRASRKQESSPSGEWNGAETEKTKDIAISSGSAGKISATDTDQ